MSENWWKDGWTDLGHDVFYKRAGCNHASETHLILKSDKDDLLGGISFCSLCEGPTWELISENPLTVTPSIHDPTTGFHGFITEGRWVPA